MYFINCNWDLKLLVYHTHTRSKAIPTWVFGKVDIYTFIGNNLLWIKMNLYALCFTRLCVRLFLCMWALVFNVFTFLQIRKIEILSLLSMTSSTTLVTINELYGKIFALFFANFHLLSKWQLSNNKETLDCFNACFSWRKQWLTIQETGYCFSLHNGKVKWLNIEVYNMSYSREYGFQTMLLNDTFVNILKNVELTWLDNT